jgi:hypothetical protein
VVLSDVGGMSIQIIISINSVTVFFVAICCVGAQIKYRGRGIRKIALKPGIKLLLYLVFNVGRI